MGAVNVTASVLFLGRSTLGNAHVSAKYRGGWRDCPSQSEVRIQVAPVQVAPVRAGPSRAQRLHLRPIAPSLLGQDAILAQPAAKPMKDAARQPRRLGGEWEGRDCLPGTTMQILAST